MPAGTLPITAHTSDTDATASPPYPNGSPDFRIPLPRRRVYAAAARSYCRIMRKVARATFSRFARAQPYVQEHYEQIWNLDPEAYVAQQDQRREVFLCGRKFCYASNWLLYQAYLNLLSGQFAALGASSVLEVGSGRGKNLALLALRNPALELTGLELTKEGVAQSEHLFRAVPSRFLEVAGVRSVGDAERTALARIRCLQGSAFEMPFPDKSFDVSFTCLVLEQIPLQFPQVLREMRRVTRRYCVFIEEFREANSILNLAHLRSRDLFRSSYKAFEAHGLTPISFSTDMPQKLRHRTGLLVTSVQ